MSYSPSPRHRPFDAIANDGDSSTDSSAASSNRPNTIATLFEEDEGSVDSGRSRTPSGPFDKIIGFETSEKENSVAVAVDTPPKLPQRTKDDPRRPAAAAVTTTVMPTRSPLRRDLVKKTQDAINVASASVNHSLNAARQAKQESYRKKTQETAKIRKEWQQDTAEAKSFYQQAEKTRREMLSLQRQLSSNYSQGKARHVQHQRHATIQAVDKESQFKSSVYRDHNASLKSEEDQRRRKSTATRAKLRANHREGESKMQLQRIEEDFAILEERHEASIALKTYTDTNAAARRKSFFFRNGDARRIRETHARLQSDEQQLEHEGMELERLAASDVQAYQRQMAAERRESFAGRNAHGRKQREEEATREAVMQQTEHEGYELNWAGERDADEYRDKMAEERRQSFAFRNAEGSRQRAQTGQERSEAQQAEHESYELNWAGERDADAYERQMEAERRESLAGRNLEGRGHREFEGQQHSDLVQSEHASYELKWAGEKDADNYHRQMEQERRESLAGRNMEGRRQREFETQQHSEAVQSEHESYELKWAGEKDAEAYERQMEAERRESLAFRNQEGRKQREVVAQMDSDTMAVEHAGYELKWAGEKDAEAYHRQLAKERRQSLAGRNQERAGHAQVMEELSTIAREKETESLVLKWAGEEDAKKYLAKMEKERRESLQLRGKQMMHHREVEAESHNEELNQAHVDEELRAADQKDVEGYRKDCAERDRTSFEYRRKEARIQRLEEEEQLLEQQQADAATFQLDTLAQTDVDDYLKECQNRRRLSLAFRAKEKRHHAHWKKEKTEQKREERSRDVRGRLMDQRYVELALQQERAQIAIDAIRHAGCSFNPFSGVLR